MTDASEASIINAEYSLGRQLRRRLSGLSGDRIGERFGIGRHRAEKVKKGGTDKHLTEYEMLIIRALFREAEVITPLVRQMSVCGLAKRYRKSTLTIRRYAGLE